MVYDNHKIKFNNKNFSSVLACTGYILLSRCQCAMVLRYSNLRGQVCTHGLANWVGSNVTRMYIHEHGATSTCTVFYAVRYRKGGYGCLICVVATKPTVTSKINWSGEVLF